MAKLTKAAIKEAVKEEGVDFLRVMFTDVFGMIKNVEIPVSELDTVLDNNLLFDGSSIDGFVRIEESDMYLYPDLDTFKILPDTMTGEHDGKVAMIVANVYTSSREVFEGDPRNNLIRVLREMKADGFSDFNVGTEPEFFLFKVGEDGKPTMELNDNGGYFDLAPLDLGEHVRREIVLTLEKMGFEVEAAHHEVAPGQHEVDFRYADAVTAADHIQLFKLIVKTVARKYGYYATFMPKPIAGINGNGMHTNMSLSKDGKNVFDDPTDKLGLSETAYHFLGGLLTHAENFVAITNPTVNSFKRLTPGFEAPVYIAWSASNRSPMVRIPASRGAATRLELRMVDPTANPYLAFAVVLASGLDGIEKKITPEHSVDKNIFRMDADERQKAGIKDLPDTLLAAVQNLERDEVVTAAISKRIADTFVEAKKLEYQSYRASVSKWELDQYLETF
ncbi:type I glutamate--ammonia ligase [Oenococcus kitaharae]|uniref:Glutamine synthetase n=1 Tax=Oenococcus kitaharae DSM 17330 TaxID=1045004 RepID=G9WFZ5_9LACO|nr:type I glutamate--ammonia ligase [Oenococcus kitaharae]EHN59573.1 Glutamine synthetase type I [Oenococcus kitaharae DSM 17330]OEY83422.1 glutamine synthetase [Oenococcus kitaharae]OEY85221.1 glutamine synthetase [Oenococcus kitaharae]OEY86075.1 glutamine synthetase [Oenococcus kitaharae]